MRLSISTDGWIDLRLVHLARRSMELGLGVEHRLKIYNTLSPSQIRDKRNNAFSSQLQRMYASCMKGSCSVTLLSTQLSMLLVCYKYSYLKGTHSLKLKIHLQ
jgi:hypothetical protein